MKDPKRELFEQALWQAMYEKRMEELAQCPDEEIVPSERHLRKLSRIFGFDLCEKKEKRRYRPKRVIAWGLAAVLLMVSALTAYAYRGTSFGFVERVYDQYTQVRFAYASDIQRTVDIEERYELTYLPPYYERSRVYVHGQRIEYTYYNAAGDEIEFQQHPLNGKGEWAFRNDVGELEIKKYGERYVYCYDCPDSRTFLWRDQKYAMVLYVSTAMDDAEILQIINGVSVQPQ